MSFKNGYWRNQMVASKLLPALMLSSLLVACAPENVKDADSSGGSAMQSADGVQTGGLNGADSTEGSFLSGMSVSYEKDAINDTGNVLIEKTI